MSNVLLECRQVTKRYGGLVAVDHVDLKIEAGETVGIGGPNGAGKTTFFDLISGLTPVSGGEVIFQGKPIAGVPSHRLFHNGMARTFQVSSGFTGLSVYQNMLAAVVFGNGKGEGLLFNQAHHRRTMESLEEFGLLEYSKDQLSGVPMLIRKKLMVASAIVHSPKLILLDEPVGGLVPAEIDEFVSIMKTVRAKGICMVFIEHVMRFHLAVADRILIMNQGGLIFDDIPSKLASDPLVRSVYLGSEADNL